MKMTGVIPSFPPQENETLFQKKKQSAEKVSGTNRFKMTSKSTHRQPGSPKPLTNQTLKKEESGRKTRSGRRKRRRTSHSDFSGWLELKRNRVGGKEELSLG